MEKNLGDVLLLCLRRGRGGRGGGGARRHRPSLVLRRSPARVGWIWWEGASSSSMAWLGEEKGEEIGVLWGKRGNRKGRGSWWWWGTGGADEDTWHSFSVQATCRHGSLTDRPRQRSGPSGGEGYVT